MSNPYKLTGPTCLSFSGGRTSAYMLFMVLTTNTAEDIARWLVVCFANTGLEAEETLVFVRECAARWGFQIVWLEYVGQDDQMYRVTSFETASRNGEPFKLELTVVNGKTIDGNCVYCFNKSPWQRLSIARMGKHSIDWYVRAADGSMVPGATGRGARFTKDGPSYADIKQFSEDQQEMFDHNQEDIACFCGD